MNGNATTGRRLPMASVRRPRARVSLIPAAHLLIVLKVAGATTMASGRRQHIRLIGLLVLRPNRMTGSGFQDR
jgi:hypothetical protein